MCSSLSVFTTIPETQKPKKQNERTPQGKNIATDGNKDKKGNAKRTQLQQRSYSSYEATAAPKRTEAAVKKNEKEQSAQVKRRRK
jgi:hypothetical protein